MTNYYDSYGRLHFKPVTASKPFPSGNSFLYSGEASLIGVPVDVDKVFECFVQCATEWGYNRNPDGDILPASSHDEIVGLFMAYNENHTPINFYNGLKKQRFQVCNLPGFKPTPFYKLNPFKVIRDFYKLSKEPNPRTATPKYPYIWPITFWHQPQHTYFYKRCAGLKPSLIHSAFHFLSCVSTICSSTGNSGKTLLGFKLIKLKKLGPSFSEKLLIKLFNKKVNFADEVRMYFPDDHPITEAVLKTGGGI